ncbi:MAG: RHS repeat-associated core domain-containing protein [Arenimonas sp.]
MDTFYSNQCGSATFESIGNQWTDETGSYAWGCMVTKTSYYQAGVPISSHKDILVRYPQRDWQGQCTGNTETNGMFLGKSRNLSCPSGAYFNGEVCIVPTNNELADKNDCPTCLAVYDNGTDPIHSGTGFSFQTETDLTGLDSMLRLERFYISATHRDPSFLGKNWRHTYDRSLLVVTDPGVTIKTASVARPGSGREYFVLTNGIWTSAADITTRLMQLGDGTWIYTDNADTQEHYSKTGRLLSITDKSGRTLTLQYADDLLNAVIDDHGRTLTFAYQYFDNLAGVPATRLTSVGLPDGQIIRYQYDANGMLERAIYPDATPADANDNPYRRYQYGDGSTATNYQMIGLFDERGIQYANWQFDGAGRAISSELGSPGSGINKVSLSINAGQPTTVTNQYGQTRSYGFATILHGRKITSMSASCPSCGANFAARTYDANGHVDVETDFNNTTTDTDYNARGLVVQKIESANKPSTKRTTQTDWHTSFNVPIERRVYNASGTLETKTKYAYNLRGQLTASCQIDPSITAAMNYVCGSAAYAPLGVRQNSRTYCEQTDVDSGACPIVGQMISRNGPRIDLTDISGYTYYQSDDASCISAPTSCPHRKGDLWKFTNALNQVTEYLAYDGAGRVISMKGANNVVTDLEYNARGWLTARKVRGLDNSSEFYDDAITRWDYDAAGQVIKSTQADGHLSGDFITFNYDAAHRLTEIRDAENNSITYDLDAAGKRIAETTKDPNSVLTRNLSRIFDTSGRLQATKNAAGLVVSSTIFDANSNIDTVTDGLNHVTNQEMDPLNRLVKTIQNEGGINAATQFTYDARSNLTAIIDPKTLNTTYTYNGLNDVVNLSSPDTGATIYTYDAAGNRKTQKDANNVTATFNYDALNRLTQVTYSGSAPPISNYYYDTVNGVCGSAETFAKRRLTKFSDPSGETQFCYDRFGNLTRKRITNNGVVRTLVYSYTRGGRLSSTTYPSGMKISYVRNQTNRITQVNVTYGTTTTIYANNITYYPFGPLSKIEFLAPGSSGSNPNLTAPTGEGSVASGGGCIPQPGGGCSPPPPTTPVIQTRVYDHDYAVQSIGGLNYSVDVSGNITGISDLEGGNAFEYDNLDRLSKVKDSDTLQDVLAFTYDSTGNRLSKKIAALAPQVYTYAATSHWVTNVAGTSRLTDANGNTLQTASNRRFTYDVRNRLIDFRTGNPSNSILSQYQYNAKGERVRKYKGTTDQARYIYDESGQLLVQESVAGGVTTTQEIFWLDDMPIGISQDGIMHGILIDHLNTPRSVFATSTQNTVWRWNLADDPFGENLAQEDPDANGILFKFDMRFPGQMYDSESGLHYNRFRDYESTTGRYSQSDPIGLSGGLSTYAYVAGSPMTASDRDGLAGSKLPPSNYLKECDAQDYKEAEARCSPNEVLRCKRNHIRRLGSGLNGNLIWNYVKADLQVECDDRNFCNRNPGTCATLTGLAVLGLLITPWPDDVLIPVVLGCGAGAAAGS